jgi:hypothetical protein
MVDTYREIPGFLGRLLPGVLLTASAMGDTLLDVEEVTPLLAANNMPDPRFKLMGAILLLLAGSLCVLLIGHLIDSVRLDESASR